MRRKLDIVNSNVEYYQVLLKIGAVVLESAIKDLEAAHAENLAVAEVLGDVARVISGSFVDPDAHDYIESGIITEIDALPMLLCQLLDEIAERGCATEPDPEPADGSTDTPTITIDGTVSVSPLSLLELITDFFGSQSHPLYYDRHA